MRILCVDDEKLELDRLSKLIKDVYEKEEIISFLYADEALDFISENEIDIAFLDIELGVISGVELAKRIKKLYPACDIVFATGYDLFMSKAFELGVSDYLTKPITKEKVNRAISNLRHPKSFKIPEKGLYIQCFGEFEVFFDGKPIIELSKKEKELFAFLVDKNGVMTTPSEINEALWEDNSDSNLRRVRKKLIDVFNNLGLDDLFVKTWGGIGIIKEKVFCDYYEYLNNNPLFINTFKGNYMSQYMWSRQTELNLKS